METELNFTSILKVYLSWNLKIYHHNLCRMLHVLCDELLILLFFGQIINFSSFFKQPGCKEVEFVWGTNGSKMGPAPKEIRSFLAAMMFPVLLRNHSCHATLFITEFLYLSFFFFLNLFSLLILLFCFGVNNYFLFSLGFISPFIISYIKTKQNCFIWKM